MNKNAFITNTRQLFINLALVMAVTGVLPSTVYAQVTGVWNTTGLTRIDVYAIKAPGLRPEHTVDIADSTYNFNVDTGFVSGDIVGTWRQRGSQYTIRANRLALENLFRQSLESQGLFVKQVQLFKSKLLGNQLDNGIWGSESYEYWIDSTDSAGRRVVLRLVMTVKVAGLRPVKANAAKSASAKAALSSSPKHNVLDAAATAVLKYLSHQ